MHVEVPFCNAGFCPEVRENQMQIKVQKNAGEVWKAPIQPNPAFLKRPGRIT